MKRISLAVLVSVAALAVVLLGANGLKTGPTKTAVCDIRKLVVEYQRFMDLTDQVKNMQDEARAEMERRESEIKAIMDQRKELKRGSPDDKKLQDLVWQKSVEVRAYGEIQKGRLEMLQMEGLRGCYDDLLREIESYSMEAGLDMVFSMREIKIEEATNTQDLEALIATRYILYSNAQVDVTSEVLKRLNDRYAAKKAEGATPAAP